MNLNSSDPEPGKIGQPIKTGTSLAVVAGATFILIYVLAPMARPEVAGMDRFVAAAVGAVALALLAGLGVWFFGWVRCWRNFRRLLFAAAALVTLVALVLAVENWRGKHAWLKHRRALEAQGEKFDFDGVLPPPVPDDQNLALTPLLAPLYDYTNGPEGVIWRDTNGIARLERMRAFTFRSEDEERSRVDMGNLEKGTFAEIVSFAQFYRGNTNYPQAPSSASPAEVALAAMGKFDAEINELRQAAATRPYTRFPIPYRQEPAWGILLPHLSHLKGLTQVLQVRAVAELELGQGDKAFADLQLALRFSDGIAQEPLLITHLVRLATAALDLQILREGLARHAWSPAQLEWLRKHFAAMDLLAEYQHAIRGERICNTSGLDYMRRNKRLMPMMEPEGRNSPLLGLVGGWFYQNMLSISEFEQRYFISAVDPATHRVFPEVATRGAEAIERLPKGPYTIFARQLLPALEKAVQRSAHFQVHVDAGVTACALENYYLDERRFPESLDALAPKYLENPRPDVMDGKPLRYRLEPSGYLIYSIGWNGVDDHGARAWKGQGKNKKPDLEAGDWVWEMPAKLPE